MRVLLAHPPLSTIGEVTPPLGLCTLAAWLVHHGHEVRIVDLDLEIKGRPDGAREYLRVLARAVGDFAPHAVGVTSMYNNSLQAQRMIETVKAGDPSIVTIAGGSHFGALGRRALERIPELDYAIEGEGEPALSALLATLERGGPPAAVPRLTYRFHGEVRTTPAAGLLDLAGVPPSWSLLDGVVDLRRYAETIPHGAARRAVYVEAGRGCPFACSFCATAPFWERTYRVKPVARLLEEIRFLYEQHGYTGFMLVHDLLTVSRDFVDELSDALMASRLPVEWMANHRTDLDLRGLLPKMKTAGCWALFFGVESASARLQKVMRKGLRREGVFATITGLSDLGIASTCSFVIGFPDETREELSETIAMGAELKVRGAGMVQFHRLRTWPPAPLSRAGLAAEFDLDSLRIEYPFLDVPPEDVTAIRGDPEFFAGYFAPESAAGTFAELAQVELFFTHAVAAMPLTVSVLGRVAGQSLIASFYRVLSSRGAVTRDQIERESASLLRVARLLRPFLGEWIAGHPALLDWQRRLVEGVMTYEARRLEFVDSDGAAREAVAAGGDNWAAFVSEVDVGAVFEAIHAGQPLTADLVQRCAVVLVHPGPNAYRAYTTEVSRLPELARQPVLLGDSAR